MTDTTQPRLELGPPPDSLTPRERRRLSVGALGGVLVVLQVTLLVWLMFFSERSAEPSLSETAREWRETALQLEERRLHAGAADAWVQSLSLSPESDERSAIWYRVGDLRRRSEDWSAAASAFVQAEVGLKESDPLRARIGPALIDCLRRLGLEGEVGRELAKRAGGEPSTGEVVVARFAGEALTEADLDRLIERDVDRRIAALGPSATVDRQLWLEQRRTADSRRQFLEQWLEVELFGRRARELGIDRDPDYRAALELLQSQLLANRYLEQELKIIEPTRIDLEAHYQANASRWARPERVETTVLALRSGESAEDVLNAIDSAEAFRTEAARRSKDQQRESGWSEMEIERGGAHPLLGRTGEVLFDLEVGHWTQEPLVDSGRAYLALVEAKHPAGAAPFEEVETNVRADYMQRKVSELTERLQKELLTRYDVRIEMPEASRDD